MIASNKVTNRLTYLRRSILNLFWYRSMRCRKNEWESNHSPSHATPLI